MPLSKVPKYVKMQGFYFLADKLQGFWQTILKRGSSCRLGVQAQ